MIKPMTLRELKGYINSIPEDRLDEIVTVYELDSGLRCDLIEVDTKVSSIIDLNFSITNNNS